MNRVALTACLAVLALLVPVRGQDSDSPPRTVLREKTYYVPFEELERVFEKTGRGIFLPYEEFLELWNAAQAKGEEPEPGAPPVAATLRGGVYTGTVEGDLARFEVSYQVEALAAGWSTVALPLQGVAIDRVELSDDEALFAAAAGSYQLHLPRPGSYELRLGFAVRVNSEPGVKRIAFGLPPLAVSRLDLTIPEREARVDVEPVLAATQSLPDGESTQVLAFLGDAERVQVSWSPPAGRAAEGGAIVFASQYVRTHLKERILRLETVVRASVMRGEVDRFRVRVPENMRLIAVDGENIREWTPPRDGVMEISLHAAITGTVDLRLRFERIFEETPRRLAVPFPAVEDVLRENGFVALESDPALRVRVARTENLSQLDPQEVPQGLLQGPGIGFRYLAQPVALELEIERIEPVVEGVTTSVVALGEQEDLWVGWIDYQIRKAGVFRLAFRVPAGWVVASIGDPSAVEEFRTEKQDGELTITVSLASKVLGDFRLPFRLTRAGSARAGDATLVPPRLLDVRRDRGLFGLSVPHAWEAVTRGRTGAVDVDVDELLRSGVLGLVPEGASLPRAFRYRTQPSAVQIALSARKTEIDVLAQHLVEVADDELRTTHLLDFNVQYAAIDRLRFTASSSLDDQLTVEAKQKTELRKVSAADGRTLWEIGLTPPVLGPVTVSVFHTRDLRALAAGVPQDAPVELVHASGVRKEQGFVAVRKEGTLEIQPSAVDMEAVDAAELPDKLRRGQIYSAFRYFAAEPRLTLRLTRFEVEELARTVVPLVRLKSVLSEEMRLKTRATIFVVNQENQYLEVDLPPEARIYSLSVAGQPQTPRRRGDGAATLIEIPSSSGARGTFPVVLVYEEPVPSAAMAASGEVALQTLQIAGGVPVNKVELALYLPPEHVYYGWRGSLQHRTHRGPGQWQRFKALLGGATAVADRSHTGFTEDSDVRAGDIEVPTRGYLLHELETLSPRGEVRFRYLSENLFWALDGAAFLVAAVLLAVLLRLLGAPRGPVCLVLLSIALIACWSTDEPVAEIARSATGGLAIVSAGFVLLGLRDAWRKRRGRRFALAPDPFLEDAEPPRSGEEPASTSMRSEDAGDAATATSARDDSPPHGADTDAADSHASDSSERGDDEGAGGDAAGDTPRKGR